MTGLPDPFRGYPFGRGAHRCPGCSGGVDLEDARCRRCGRGFTRADRERMHAAYTRETRAQIRAVLAVLAVAAVLGVAACGSAVG